MWISGADFENILSFENGTNSRTGGYRSKVADTLNDTIGDVLHVAG